MASDVTMGSNTEKHPLSIIAGMTSDNETLSAIQVYLLLQSHWVFNWQFSIAFPALHRKYAIARNQLNLTDCDEQEYNAFIALTGPGGLFEGSSHALCSWHMISQGFKRNNITSHVLDKRESLYSWTSSIESEVKFNILYSLLRSWLQSDDVKESLRKSKVKLFLTFIGKCIPHKGKILFAERKKIHCFNTQTTTFVKAKRHPLGPRPNQSLNQSVEAVTSIGEVQLAKKEQNVATALDKKFTGTHLCTT